MECVIQVVLEVVEPMAHLGGKSKGSLQYNYVYTPRSQAPPLP